VRLVPSYAALPLGKRLEGVISVSFVQPAMLDHGWIFDPPDPITGARYAHEIYQRADSAIADALAYRSSGTRTKRTIVVNESEVPGHVREQAKEFRQRLTPLANGL
jgi:glutathionyl-hydroquinone reductase